MAVRAVGPRPDRVLLTVALASLALGFTLA